MLGTHRSSGRRGYCPPSCGFYPAWRRLWAKKCREIPDKPSIDGGKSCNSEVSALCVARARTPDAPADDTPPRYSLRLFTDHGRPDYATAQQRLRQYQNAASGDGAFDPSLPPDGLTRMLSLQHKRVDSRFSLLANMSMEASDLEKQANAGKRKEQAKGGEDKTDRFERLSEELKGILLGDPSEKQDETGASRRKKSATPHSPKLGSGGGGGGPVKLHQKIEVMSRAQAMIAKQLREFRASAHARKELRARAKAYIAKHSVKGPHVKDNKKNAFKPEIRAEAVRKVHLREKKLRVEANIRRLKLEESKTQALEARRKEVYKKFDSEFGRKRKLARFQRMWLRLLALQTRTLCMADTIEAQQCPLDFEKLTMPRERKSLGQAWLARRRVLRTRAALGTLWRCLVLQSTIDRFRDHVLDRETNDPVLADQQSQIVRDSSDSDVSLG